MAKYAWLLAGLVLASYFVGNINFALIISKLKKSDVRKLGSGNPGTLNMSRNFGLKIGLLTLFLDMLKGAIPRWSGISPSTASLSARARRSFICPISQNSPAALPRCWGIFTPSFSNSGGGRALPPPSACFWSQ